MRVKASRKRTQLQGLRPNSRWPPMSNCTRRRWVQLEVAVKQRGRRDCEKFYFKPMPSQMAVIVFVKFVANKGATNSTN